MKLIAPKIEAAPGFRESKEIRDAQNRFRLACPKTMQIAADLVNLHDELMDDGDDGEVSVEAFERWCRAVDHLRAGLIAAGFKEAIQ